MAAHPPEVLNRGATVDIAALIEARGLSGFHVRLMLLSGLVTLFDALDQMLIAFTAPYMRGAMGLTKPMLGTIFSGGLLGMMLGGFFFAYWADRIGRRPTLLTAAILGALATLATVLADSFPALLLARFVTGFMVGGMLPLCWTLNIEFAPRRPRATVVTVVMMGYSIGNSVAGPLTVRLADAHGWRAAYAVAGGGTLLSALALLLWLPESVRFLAGRGLTPARIARTLGRLAPDTPFSATDRFVLGDEPHAAEPFRVRRLFAGRLAWITPLLWLGYTINSIAIYFGASWSPIIYEEVHIPRATAATAIGLAGALGAVAGLALMRFTDRYGPACIAVLALAGVPVLLTIGLVPLGQGPLLLCVVAAGTLVGGAHYGVISIAGLYYPSAIRANGAGWATSVAKVGAVLAPMAGAALLSSGMPPLRSFALLALCPLGLGMAMIGIAWVLRRSPARP